MRGRGARTQRIELNAFLSQALMAPGTCQFITRMSHTLFLNQTLLEATDSDILFVARSRRPRHISIRR